MKTIKSHSLDQGSASVCGAALDENTVDDGARECSSGGSQTDGRPSSRVMIRNAGVECVRDQKMNLKRTKHFQSITKCITAPSDVRCEDKIFTL